MLEKRTKEQPKTQKQNNPLQAARKKIVIQAVIAIQAVIITVALVFGMSAAWYSNVLQTSGLQFEAEAWGFTGDVQIGAAPIQARPGQSDSIDLTVSNQGDQMIDVAVRVSKEQMVENMQQRLFFYVDTALARNDETMDRVYINSRDSYTYTLLSQSELMLTKQQANDALLKWQWVYDMEGYYFLGTVTTQTGQNNETTVVAQVEDYLRPVEYDLDSATFTDGQLTGVDGMSTEEFLKALSEKDGYAKDITPTEMPGYYRVDVDETGHGIWVYLCNWAQIQQATTYDSQLGLQASQTQQENGTPERYVARLTVIGQTKPGEYADINTQDQLAAQLQEGNMARLQRDIVLKAPLQIDSGGDVILDLNGHTIQAPAGESALTVSNATNMILLNGQLQAEDPQKNAVTVNGSMLTMSNVDIVGQSKYGVYVSDSEGNVDSRIRLFDCNIDAATGAVMLRGNGENSSGRTQLIVDSCVLNSDYMGIIGNGTQSYWGTDIQITDSQISGYYTALYQPQGDSTARVKNSTLTGGTGVVIKGGDLWITDSTVRGTFAEEQIQAPVLDKNGFSDTGDGLFVDCSYGLPMYIQIEGNSVIQKTAQSARSVRVFVPEDGADSATVTITGGTYSDSVAEYVDPAYEYDPQSGTVVPKATVEGEGNGE